MEYLPEQYYSPLQKTVAYVLRSLNKDAKSTFSNQILFEGEARQPGHIFKAGFLSHFISRNIQNEGSVIQQIYHNDRDELVFRVYLNYFNAVSHSLRWNWKTPAMAAALFGLSEDVFLACRDKKDFSYEAMCSGLTLLSGTSEGTVSAFTSSRELYAFMKGRLRGL